MRPKFICIMAFLTVAFFCADAAGQYLKNIAPVPPMGWNSYDAYDWRINETEFKANTDFLAGKLLKYGWNYAVIDYLWFTIDKDGAMPLKQRKPASRYHKYDKEGKPAGLISVDEFGRLIPDVNRFPSSANGNGFKALADYAHSKGLKFGIHIMRGIPRYAVYYNLPVKGTKYKARDIANVSDTCMWENSMYGVDYRKPGAQEYYNSIVEMYAGWGVDFIKADDEMTPYFRMEEINLLVKAIKKSKRPIVLSLSPGSVPFSQSEFLSKNINMWRISDDFWDSWESLYEKFEMLNSWSNYIKPGTWPDADMLPVGRLSLNNTPVGRERNSRFTKDEHCTLLTLYSIARSPLIIGSDLPSMPDSTLQFLTNREVLEVNRNSVNNRLIYKLWGEKIVWIAVDPKTGDRYLALFNTGDKEKEVSFDFMFDKLEGKYKIRDLWQHKDLGEYSSEFKAVLPKHGAGLYRMTKVK